MSFAEINGANLHYEVKGEGKPLLLIHGYGLDLRMWDAQFEEFANHYQVIRVDLAGSGKSSPHDIDFSLLDDLKGLLQFLDIEKVNLIGFSVGGNISMDFATTFPEMVDQLILVSTGLLGWSDFSDERKQYMEGLKNCEALEDTIQLMCKAWLAGPYRTINDLNSELVDIYTSMIRMNLSRESGKGKMLLPEKKTIELVEAIAAQTLIVSPDIDFPEFKWIANYLNEKIANSQVKILQGTAHMLNMEKPDEFNRIVMEFLKN